MTMSCFLGCIRALGTQASVALFSLGCYYLIGMPMAYYLGIVLEMNVLGLWLGYFIGFITLTTAFA